MGHIIEQVARRRGHEIVCIIDRDNTADFLSPAFSQADVAIEFSTPATAEANIRAAWPLSKEVNTIVPDMPLLPLEKERGSALPIV